MFDKTAKVPSLLRRTLGEGRLANERLKVLLLTFLSYMCFHASRIPPSITKGVLHPHSESAGDVGTYDPWKNPGWLPFSQDLVPDKVSRAGYRIDNSKLCDLDEAGLFTCTQPERTVTKHGLVSHWCSRYTSKNYKFKLNRLTGSKSEKKCGIANSTKCWVIAAVYQNITAAQRQKYCTKEDCVLFVQSGGYRLPAEVDSDTVQWVAAKKHYGNPPEVVPSLTNGKVLLGSLMTVYLLFYAGGMFVSGHIADQVSLRLFLSFGMFVSGALVAGIGFAKALDQHSLVYFYSVYGVQGLFQSIGVSFELHSFSFSSIIFSF